MDLPAHAGLFGHSLRTPPHAAQAEQALLGAVLANNKAFDRVADFLAAEHFADPLHGAIYAAARRRIEAGQLADVVTLRPEMEASGLLEDAPGGAGYLATLLGAMVGVINAGEYGRLIHDCWLRRQLIDVGEEVVNRAYGAEADLTALDQVEAAETRLLSLALGSGDGRRLVSADRAADAALRAMEAAMERGDGLSGLTSGLRGLDRKTGGLQAGEMVILAGRPSMGKTGLALTIAARAAEDRMAAQAARLAQDPKAKAPVGQVLLVSAEMDATPIGQRLLAALAGLPVNAIIRGHIEDWSLPPAERYRRLSDAECARVVRARAALDGLPLVIDETPRQSVAAVRAKARQMARGRDGLSLVVVDYLQLLRASGDAMRKANRVAEVSEISADLKALAKELRVPVLALSQLSRDVEKREDKRPVLADLRDSGSIEQDADGVWFVYRAHYYLTREMPQQTAKDSAEAYEAKLATWHQRVHAAKGKAELIIAKNRQGPTGPVPLRFRDETTWFLDETEELEGPAVPGLGEDR